MNKIFASTAATLLLATSLPAPAKDADIAVVGAGLAGLSAAALPAVDNATAVTIFRC